MFQVTSHIVDFLPKTVVSEKLEVSPSELSIFLHYKIPGDWFCSFRLFLVSMKANSPYFVTKFKHKEISFE